MLKRLTTGIPGLDDVTNGGFIVPSSILIVGEAGTGKTTFGLQYLFHGAKKGEKGLYITGLSEPSFVVKGFMSSFSFYDERYMEEGLIEIWDYGKALSTFTPERALEDVTDVIVKSKPARIVIDPLPSVHLFTSQLGYQRYLYKTLVKLKMLDAVCVFIGEQALQDPTRIEGYMVDGVICLGVNTQKGHELFVQVRKMRGVGHTREILPLTLSQDGVSIFPSASTSGLNLSQDAL